MSDCELSTLIAELEKAEAGSRELDIAIEDVVGVWENLGGWWRQHKLTGKRERFTYHPPPPYTTSIDAALTLVPFDMWSGVDIEPERDGGRGRAIVNGSAETDSHAATPALALCIAALRAREAGHE